MMLRIMLVGIVASLGLELPSNDDVSHWARSGHRWASARLADLSEIRSETCRAFGDLSDPEVKVITPAPDPLSGSAAFDVAFQAVVDQVAGELAADLGPFSPATEVATKVEPATSLPPVVEVAAQASPALAVEVAVASEFDEVPSDELEVTLLTEVSPSRGERIQSAVKITVHAVNAWASVLQPADPADTGY